MDPSSKDGSHQRTMRRSSDSHYSATTKVAPTTAQRSSAKPQNEGGQKYKQVINRKDCRYEVKLSYGDKTQARRHSLGAYNPSLHPSRSGTMPMSYRAKMRRNSADLSPSSFRVLRHENELQRNPRKGQLNRVKSEDNDRSKNASSLAFEGKKHDLFSNPSEGSGTAIAGKTLKSRAEMENPSKAPRKANQRSNPKTNRGTKLNAEEQRNELDRRIKTFNQNMDRFNQNDATTCMRKMSLEKPCPSGVKTDTHAPRSMSLPVVFTSYSDLNFQRLSPEKKNSFASLRHCRYLRIPASPELTIREIFQHHNKKEKVDKETKFPRK